MIKMRNTVKGSMTIFLSLLMLLFLSFCLVLMEGIRNYFLRFEAEIAIDLTGFSILSEYQQELFEHYGLFFLDLDYEQGTERVAVLENRARKYLSENAVECETQEVFAENFCRATDEDGTAFFEQAVEQMKVESGYKIFEELVNLVGPGSESTLDVGEVLEENETTAQDILESAVDAEGLPLFDISLPGISFPSINALTESIFGDMKELSEKTVNLEERMLKRILETGDGENHKINFTDMQLFHSYLLSYFNYYGKNKNHASEEVLEYQLEYMIAGNANDRKNLEEIMWKIFLLRVSGNYMFYHQDAEKIAVAETEALAIAGVSGNPILIKAVKEILLIAESIESSIQETKFVFEGEKVPLYQNGVWSNLELGYEEYLYLLLNATDKREKIYRCMDIVELEIREKASYKSFRLDHCTDCFTLTWSYEFDSLFLSVPLFEQGKYRNTITKKVFYEK